MLQSARASTLTMPPSFGHNLSLTGVQKMEGYSDTDSWNWPQQHSHAHSQAYPQIFDPALYANLAPHLQAPGSVQSRHHSIATSHILQTGQSTPPPPRQQSTGTMIKAQPAFKPTWHGFLDTTKDAMTIVEAALQGRLNHISRRPHDKERAEMLTSGTVLVYEENASGIKRWTDAVHWSPSRVMNNCLIYRQLVRALKPEEKKAALNPSCGTKRKRKESGSPSVTKAGDNINNSEDEYENPGFDGLPGDATPTDSLGKVYANFAQGLTPDQQRRFCGSLIDSYEFKEGGLMKKTISVKYQGTHHHIISYYSLEDVVNGKLKRPSQDPKLADIHPRPELLNGWKVSLEDEENRDLPMVPGYAQQLPTSHLYHSAVPHGLPLVQGHPSLHLQVPEYWQSAPVHHYTATHHGSQQYPSPHPVAPQYAATQPGQQYPQHESSPHNYSSQPPAPHQYTQPLSPQPYSSQQPPSQQYPPQSAATAQFGAQSQPSRSYSEQYPQQTPSPQYEAPHSASVAPPHQYAVPQAPVFDLHVPVAPPTTQGPHPSQSPSSQHDSTRRASAPVALQSYGQPPYNNTAQPQSYYVSDQKYNPGHNYGF